MLNSCELVFSMCQNESTVYPTRTTATPSAAKMFQRLKCLSCIFDRATESGSTRSMTAPIGNTTGCADTTEPKTNTTPTMSHAYDSKYPLDRDQGGANLIITTKVNIALKIMSRCAGINSIPRKCPCQSHTQPSIPRI